MKHLPRNPEGDGPSLIEMLFRSPLDMSRELWLFLLFSLADVVLTVKLLAHGGYVESNPIARFFLLSWGARGMVYFKFALVAATCVLIQIIAHKRHATARRLLNFAVLVVGAVVTYSSLLYIRAVL